MQAFPGVLIQDGEQSNFAAIGRGVFNEIVAPHLIGPLSLVTHTFAFGQMPPLAPSASCTDAVSRAQACCPLVVDHLFMLQPQDLGHFARTQFRMLLRHFNKQIRAGLPPGADFAAPVTGRARHAQHTRCAPDPAHPHGHHVLDCMFAVHGAYHFFEFTSLRIWMSKAWSATRRLSR